MDNIYLEKFGNEYRILIGGACENPISSVEIGKDHMNALIFYQRLQSTVLYLPPHINDEKDARYFFRDIVHVNWGVPVK
jgi:hypothetical protein